MVVLVAPSPLSVNDEVAKDVVGKDVVDNEVVGNEVVGIVKLESAVEF